MKEKNIIQQVIAEIDNITESNVGVRTIGGDQDVNPPEVIIDWNADRQAGRNGHHPRGGFITDAQGDEIGYELHLYWRANVECLARSYSETEANDILNTVQDHFSVYEYNSDFFDSDTAMWSIGDLGPRANAVVEPDWYELGVPLRFEYLRRVARTTDYDTLETIQKEITEDSDTLVDGETTIG